MFSVVYHPEAREEATALPVKIRVKFDRLIGKLEYDARLLREPDTKPLGDGLFEIRTMGTEASGYITKAIPSSCSGFSSRSLRKRQQKKSISPESG